MQRDDPQTWCGYMNWSDINKIHKKNVMCKISAQYVKACRRKLQKIAQIISNNLKIEKEHWLLQKLTQNEVTRKWSEVYKKNSYTKFQLNISKYVKKSAENCISSMLSSERDITTTKSDAKRRHSNCSVVHKKKVMYKILGQCVKACRRKEWETVYFQYFKFQKGHNSYKKIDANWRLSDLIQGLQKESHIQIFNSLCQSM